MRGNVFEGPTDFLQRALGAGMCRVETAKQMGQLGCADAGMVDDPRFEQVIDILGCLSLEYVDVNRGVEQQLGASRCRPSNHGQVCDRA